MFKFISQDFGTNLICKCAEETTQMATFVCVKRRLNLAKGLILFNYVSPGQPINEPERQAAVGEAAKITNTTTKSEEDKNEAEPGSKVQKDLNTW